MYIFFIFFYVCILLIFYRLEKTVHGILIRTDTILDLSHKAEKLCPWHYGTYFVCLVMSFQIIKCSTLPFVMALLKSFNNELNEHVTLPFCRHVQIIIFLQYEQCFPIICSLMNICPLWKILASLSDGVLGQHGETNKDHVQYIKASEKTN